MIGGSRHRKNRSGPNGGGFWPTNWMSPPTSNPTTISRQLSGTIEETRGVMWNPGAFGESEGERGRERNKERERESGVCVYMCVSEREKERVREREREREKERKRER